MAYTRIITNKFSTFDIDYRIEPWVENIMDIYCNVIKTDNHNSFKKGIKCMTKSLDGKVAIVTGASRDLGRAFSEMLAGEGASVVVHYNDPNI